MRGDPNVPPIPGTTESKYRWTQKRFFFYRLLFIVFAEKYSNIVYPTRVRAYNTVQYYNIDSATMFRAIFG